MPAVASELVRCAAEAGDDAAGPFPPPRFACTDVCVANVGTLACHVIHVYPLFSLLLSAYM